MEKTVLKEVILEQKKALRSFDTGTKRDIMDMIAGYLPMPHAVIISGIRRVGKSTLLAQIIKNYYKDEVFYFSFEDERLINFGLEDFNNLYEIFLELYGEKKVFFFDEIQNVPKWEIFVRRMQDKGSKFFLTGSNASLLSKELGTKLTGRCIMLELYPFSFREFLNFKGYSLHKDALSYTAERAEIKKYFNEYLGKGGMPEYLKYKDMVLLKRIYEDILYRDIVARYEIKEVKALRELAFYFISNVTGLFSYNNLKQILQLGSVNTVRSYVDYLENSFLVYATNRFSYSLKQQFIANKKIYCIDNGIVESVSFQFSKNKGRFLENLVFVELKRRYGDIYYYKTTNNLEVDFLVKEGKNKFSLYQVSESLNNAKVRQREISSLVSSMNELKINNAFILTEDSEERIQEKNKAITVTPVYKWLLENK